MMRPSGWNKIKKRLQAVETVERERAAYAAVARLAFERDPDR